MIPLLTIHSGISYDDVSAPAVALKTDSNVVISVVGIGNVNRRQIEQMASEPLNDFVTTVTNFNSLNLVVEGIASKITFCQVSRFF